MGLVCTPASPERRRLLLQPHGFEGVGPAIQVLDTNNQTVAEGPDLVVDALYGYPASLTSRAIQDGNDDLLADIDRIEGVRLVALEGLQPQAKELADAVWSSKHRLVNPR